MASLGNTSCLSNTTDYRGVTRELIYLLNFLFFCFTTKSLSIIVFTLNNTVHVSRCQEFECAQSELVEMATNHRILIYSEYYSLDFSPEQTMTEQTGKPLYGNTSEGISYSECVIYTAVDLSENRAGKSISLHSLMLAIINFMEQQAVLLQITFRQFFFLPPTQ